MSEEEKTLREQIAKEISANLKAAFENCACLGRDALIPGPCNMTTTYVERMHEMIIGNIIKANLK
jgi:hypothetical protein